MMNKNTFILIFTIILVIGSGLWGQKSASTPEERLKAFDLHLKMKDNSIFKTLAWREIGPYYLGGRIDDIEGYENNPYKFYVAAASGGLWVTENNGTTWKSIFDNESSITIGDIAISQNDESLIWVGTGEHNSSRSSYAGTGVFKSTDGGKSWQNMGLRDSHHISRIIIDPKDNNTVYVGAIGHLYTENEERGLFKTMDGGKTWNKVLFISAKTGIIDIAMHPKNNQILYAAAWERDRKAWNFIESGAESAIYKSTDGGKSWKRTVSNFPQGVYVGRIGLGVTTSNPDVVYAFLDNQAPKPESKDGKRGTDANANLFTQTIIGPELYKSNDCGETWTKTHKDYVEGLVYTYGYYFGQVRVAPDNENIIYLLGVPLMKSVDGGNTIKDISPDGSLYDMNTVHPDLHAMWINPKNPKHIILGTDGGLNISYDEGISWQKIDNLPLAQCYTIQYDNMEPYNVYSGLQDNGVNSGPSDYRLRSLDGNWRLLMGGDGAFVQPDPENPNLVYGESQFGNIMRRDLKNPMESRFIKPRPEDKNLSYRFNWLSPFFVSPHNPRTLYMGANVVLRTTDRGDHWSEISGDLTNKKNTDGDVPYATITAVDESPIVPELLYAGTDDGNVWVKKDALSAWEKINNGLPVKWVTRLVTSKYKKERIYVTMTGYRDDDFKTYVYCSEDYGKTWKSLKGNLPDESVNVIREDTENENILYLGTDISIYTTLDRGTTWYSLRNNLPVNAVYDLRVHPMKKELIIGTHGRGVFITPIAKIQELTGDVLAKPFHIYNIGEITLARGPYSQQEPMVVEYYCKMARKLNGVIKKQDGTTVTSFELEGVRGLNRWTWDLIVDKTTKKTIEIGKYILSLTCGKDTLEAEFDVTEPTRRREREPENLD